MKLVFGMVYLYKSDWDEKIRPYLFYTSGGINKVFLKGTEDIKYFLSFKNIDVKFKKIGT